MKKTLSKTIDNVQEGLTFVHPEKGECTVILKTPRTITIRHRFGTTKNTYYTKDAYFLISDF